MIESDSSTKIVVLDGEPLTFAPVELPYEWNKGAGQTSRVHLFRLVPPSTAYPACHCGANDYAWKSAPELAHLGCESGKSVLRGEVPHWIHYNEIQKMAREIAESNAT